MMNDQIPPQFPQVNSFTRNLKLCVFALVIAVLSSLGTYWYMSKNSSQQSKQQIYRPTPIVKQDVSILPSPTVIRDEISTVKKEISIQPTVIFDETSKWIIYSSDEFGFSFDYPESWGKATLSILKPDGTVETGYGRLLVEFDKFPEMILIGYSDDLISGTDGDSRLTQGFKIINGNVVSNHVKDVIKEARLIKTSSGKDIVYFDNKEEANLRGKRVVYYGGINLSNSHFHGLQIRYADEKMTNSMNLDQFIRFIKTFK